MRKYIALAVVLFSVLFTGCAERYNVQAPLSNVKGSYTVVPFANYTQTPLAGYRVASIAEGVLRSKGLAVDGTLWNYEEHDYSSKEIKEILSKASGSDFVVSGYVNEYRYKTGIDGEPAVSVTVKIYDVKRKKFIWRGVASKTGWSYESLGTVTQKAIDELLNGIFKS